MKRIFIAALAATTFALPAFANDTVRVEDPYARASTGMSQSGAAFMRLVNEGDQDIRLVAAESDVAAKVELHTHREDANGVMRMIHVEEGFTIPAGGTHELARGGDHVMFLGLTQSLQQGDMVNMTLIFDKGERVEVTAPVDMERAANMGGHMGGGAMGGNMEKPASGHSGHNH